MNEKEKIVELLKNNFGSIYCDTCGYEDSSRCEECRRKAMNWGISESFACILADVILAETKEEL